MRKMRKVVIAGLCQKLGIGETQARNLIRQHNMLALSDVSGTSSDA